MMAQGERSHSDNTGDYYKINFKDATNPTVKLYVSYWDRVNLGGGRNGPYLVLIIDVGDEDDCTLGDYFADGTVDDLDDDFPEQRAAEFYPQFKTDDGFDWQALYTHFLNQLDSQLGVQVGQ